MRATTHYGWPIPDPGDHTQIWIYTNVFSDVDTVVKALSDSVDARIATLTAAQQTAAVTWGTTVIDAIGVQYLMNLQGPARGNTGLLHVSGQEIVIDRAGAYQLTTHTFIYDSADLSAVSVVQQLNDTTMICATQCRGTPGNLSVSLVGISPLYNLDVGDRIKSYVASHNAVRPDTEVSAGAGQITFWRIGDQIAGLPTVLEVPRGIPGL